MFPWKTREAKASGVPFVALSQLGNARWTRDKASLTREGMLHNAIGYRCVRLIAEAAAGVRWRVNDGAKDALALLEQTPNNRALSFWRPSMVIYRPMGMLICMAWCLMMVRNIKCRAKSIPCALIV